MKDKLTTNASNEVESRAFLVGAIMPSASISGCELMKCKYYVDGKCTDPNEWVNEDGDAVCGLREDAILVE